MLCKNCGEEISIHDKFCSHCGTTNDIYVEGDNKTIQQVPMMYYNTSQTGLILGIISLSIVVVSFIIFGFLSFVTFILSIIGLVKTRDNLNGSNAAAITINIIALILSIIAMVCMVIIWSNLSKYGYI